MGWLNGLFRRSKAQESPEPGRPNEVIPEADGQKTDGQKMDGQEAGPVPDQQEADLQEARRKEPVLQVSNIQGVGTREHQEDSFAVRNWADPRQQEQQGLLAIVADGMGGMAHGSQASQCTVDVLLERFQCRDEEIPIPNWLYAGAFEANEQVFRQFGGQSGTTLTAVHIQNGRLYWLSVGDSAIYLMRDGGVYQLNREHTYLNRLYARELEEETIDKSRAESDVDARRLTSFVGIDHLQEVDVSLRPLNLKCGDAVLLCSDGISGVLTPPELREAMALPPDEGCALLETMVLEKQIPAQDNYTGVMIAYR